VVAVTISYLVAAETIRCWAKTAMTHSTAMMAMTASTVGQEQTTWMAVGATTN
jgi:hypothetical protein